MVRLFGIWIILILCVSSWGWASVPEEAADLTFHLACKSNPDLISKAGSHSVQSQRVDTDPPLFDRAYPSLPEIHFDTRPTRLQLLPELLPIRDGGNPKVRVLSRYTVDR